MLNIGISFIRIINRITDVIVKIVLFIVVVYCIYAIADNLSILYNASPDKISIYKPQVEGDVLSFDEILEINKDVVGWLTIDGTSINYPVVKGENNNEYVNKDIFGDFSLPGTPFVDCRNSKKFDDEYIIIYGHHIFPGIMFSDLDKFMDESFFENHPEGELMTKDGKIYTIEFTNLIYVDSLNYTIYNPILKTDTDKKIQRKKLLSEVRKNSKCNRDTENTNNTIIALSTCSSEDTNGRIVLIGNLVEKK